VTREFIIDKGHKIFSNEEVARTLSPEAVTVVFDYMVKNSEAEFKDPSSNDRYLGVRILFLDASVSL
jgi:hypothetical protein